jgi:hypothetical protein
MADVRRAIESALCAERRNAEHEFFPPPEEWVRKLFRFEPKVTEPLRELSLVAR